MTNLKPTNDNLVQYASSGALKFAGSIIVLSIAFKIIGLDLAPLVQSYAIHAEKQLENSYSNELINDLETRIETLESEVALLKIDSHPPKQETKTPH